MTKKSLIKLKNAQPPKFRETLAKQFNVTVGYIDQIFRNEKKRSDVIDAAIKLAEEHKEYLADQEKKINQL